MQLEGKDVARKLIVIYCNFLPQYRAMNAMNIYPQHKLDMEIYPQSKLELESQYIFKRLEKLRTEEMNAVRYSFKNIHKIDNIEVDVSIISHSITNHERENMFYRIETSNIHRIDDGEGVMLYTSKSFYDTTLSIEQVVLLLDDLHENIGKMKLNKYTEMFETEECCEDFDEYKKDDECCVCMEKTRTKTDCKHSLCIGCWSQLQKRCCPMCKTKNMMVWVDEEYEIDIL
jgi:hypothetical protein